MQRRRHFYPGSPQAGSLPRRNEGLPGAWAILFMRAVVNHPAGCGPPLAHLSVRSPWPSSYAKPSAPGIFANFGATYPRPTRSRTYASPDPLPVPAQGSLPARAGSPLAGRDLHPLDDEQGFMKSSHTSFLLDQPCLVAPHIWRTAFVSSLWRVAADPLRIVLAPRGGRVVERARHRVVGAPLEPRSVGHHCRRLTLAPRAFILPP